MARKGQAGSICTDTNNCSYQVLYSETPGATQLPPTSWAYRRCWFVAKHHLGGDEGVLIIIVISLESLQARERGVSHPTF
eukprot:scaffold236957_cov22-Prasinocladus_malaysianus.AAC.1